MSVSSPVLDAGIEAPPAAPGGYWRQGLRRLLRDRLATAGLVLVVLVVAVALLGPLVYGADPNLQTSEGLTPEGEPLGPRSDYPLGTDALGRDELARLLHGALISLGTAVLAIALAAVIGVVVGGLAGISQGVGRELLMRAVDVMLSIPTLLLAMVFLAFATPSLLTVAAIIAIGWGAYLARIVFGIVSSLAGRDMTAAAIAAGATRRRVLFRHLLPHALPAVIVYVTLGVGLAIQVEAMFGYIGVGIPPPEATWGNMIAEGQGYIVADPRLVLVPAGAIVLAVLGFTLLGDGLRQALDPDDTRAGDGAPLGS